MTVDQGINNSVSIPEGTKSRIIRCTPRLRWYYPYGFNSQGSPSVLQQAWEGVEDGIVEWRDVPAEIAQ